MMPHKQTYHPVFIDRIAERSREIMRLVASICLSVCLSRPQGCCLCVCNRWAFADNHMDAVDQLLIMKESNMMMLLYWETFTHFLDLLTIGGCCRYKSKPFLNGFHGFGYLSGKWLIMLKYPKFQPLTDHHQKCIISWTRKGTQNQ